MKSAICVVYAVWNRLLHGKLHCCCWKIQQNASVGSLPVCLDELGHSGGLCNVSPDRCRNAQWISKYHAPGRNGGGSCPIHPGIGTDDMRRLFSKAVPEPWLLGRRSAILDDIGRSGCKSTFTCIFRLGREVQHLCGGWIQCRAGHLPLQRFFLKTTRRTHDGNSN